MRIGDKSPYLSDIWSNSDALSFGAFKPALMQILQQAETPLTVGVFGTWGSGKTTLLNMLKSEIDAKGLPSLRAVWFTAWKYEKDEALWRAFILRVIDALYPKDENKRRYPVEKLLDKNQRTGAEYLEKLERSVYETVDWEEAGKWTLDVGELAKQGLRLPFWLAFHLAGLGDAGKDLGLNPKVTEILEREVREQHMDQLVSMEQFEATFESALRLILGKDGRLIVFVDDLDRCLPERAVEVLEAIKLFLDVPGTIFVLGMDRGVIQRGIETHYGALLNREGRSQDDMPINADVYLQKMIQLPFNLPPLDLKGREEFIRQLEGTLPEDFHLDKETREAFARGLYPNPRQVKRALNVFYLLQSIAMEQEARRLITPGVLAWPLLAKTVVIQSQWPELYQLWRQHPTLIQTLEDEYTRQPVSEEEILGGSPEASDQQSDHGLPTEGEPRAKDGQKASGLIAPFLNNRQYYALLADLLRFPEETGEGRQRARFEGLRRTEVQIYVGLVGSVEVGLVPAGHTTATPALAETEAEGVSGEGPGSDITRIREIVRGGNPVRIREIMRGGGPNRIREILGIVEQEEPRHKGPLHQGLIGPLLDTCRSSDFLPVYLAPAADALDAIGWLPRDLDDLLPRSVRHSPIYAAKYPVTNVRYQRFLDAPDFGQSEFWMDIPAFDEDGKPLHEAWSNAGWIYLHAAQQDRAISPDSKHIEPAYWDDPSFGFARNGVPVVGISWFEANAYCRWLLKHWNELEEGRSNPHIPHPRLIRLPTEREWVALAGGDEPDGRYPWDKEGKTTKGLYDILRRCNVDSPDGNLGCSATTQVWLYPLGASPGGAMDMAGNVAEWQMNFWNRRAKGALSTAVALRGGSWNDGQGSAIVAKRGYAEPECRSTAIGFRVVCIPG